MVGKVRSVDRPSVVQVSESEFTYLSEVRSFSVDSKFILSDGDAGESDDRGFTWAFVLCFIATVRSVWLAGWCHLIPVYQPCGGLEWSE